MSCLLRLQHASASSLSCVCVCVCVCPIMRESPVFVDHLFVVSVDDVMKTMTTMMATIGMARWISFDMDLTGQRW